ncbi:MAG: hypothetical protein H2069_04005 [Legionella sp.]|nr:hypothetical protein [Legionella sp.]
MKTLFKILHSAKSPLQQLILQSTPAPSTFFKRPLNAYHIKLSSSCSPALFHQRMIRSNALKETSVDKYRKFFLQTSQFGPYSEMNMALIDSMEKVKKFLETRSHDNQSFEEACLELQLHMRKSLIQIVEEEADVIKLLYGSDNRRHEIFIAIDTLLRSIEGTENIFIFCQAFKYALKEIIQHCLENVIVPENNYRHDTTQILLEAFPEDLEKYINTNPERLSALLPYVERMQSPLNDFYIDKIADIIYQTMDASVTLRMLNHDPQLSNLHTTQVLASKVMNLINETKIIMQSI